MRLIGMDLQAPPKSARPRPAGSRAGLLAALTMALALVPVLRARAQAGLSPDATRHAGAVPAAAPASAGQVSAGQPAAGQAASPVLTDAEAQALVHRALATEAAAARDLGHAGHPMRYRLHKTSPRLTTTKDIVETKDGDVARLLSVNDQPLSAESEQQESARLQALVDHPGLQQHRKQSEDSDTARALKVLEVLPAAFVYAYAGAATGGSGNVEKFTFKPRPGFDPPDLETGVLTAMAGEIWIDPVQERVVRLAGSLQQDKDFGMGILGELDKGGWVEIEQADVGARQWRIVHLKLVMNGRVLFKARNSNSVQEYSGFEPVAGDLTYTQAIGMLRRKP
jgi:hypothetical protein